MHSRTVEYVEKTSNAWNQLEHQHGASLFMFPEIS